MYIFGNCYSDHSPYLSQKRMRLILGTSCAGRDVCIAFCRVPTSNYRTVDKRIDGYPRFAACLASAPNFHIGRDYKEARIRVRLHKMHVVERKQAELEELDRKQSAEDEYSVTSIAEDLKFYGGKRTTLIKELDMALRELGEWIVDSEAKSSLQ
jgi:hypothetical protein